MSQRVTLADLARHTGLSVATISLALNDRPGSRIPAATVARVKEAARELGYRPNRSARALRSGKSGVIGFVSDEVTITRFASPMITGLLNAAEARGYGVMMMETEHRQDRFDAAVESLLERNVDGIVIGIMASHEFELKDVPVPVVVVNGRTNGKISVLPDELKAGADAVDHLVRAGHQRIALIGRHPTEPTPDVSVNIGARMDGIDGAMARHGLTFVDEVTGAVWEPELGYQGTKTILGRSNPTAIIVANDQIAFGVYMALADEGLSVPDDVSVMSFDDEDLASLVRPGMTTMRLPYRDMGQAGAETVIDLVENKDSATPTPDGDHHVPVIRRELTLIERGSVKNLT